MRFFLVFAGARDSARVRLALDDLRDAAGLTLTGVPF